MLLSHTLYYDQHLHSVGVFLGKSSLNYVYTYTGLKAPENSVDNIIPATITLNYIVQTSQGLVGLLS